MKHLVPDDRGLGTAYERYCFYQMLEDWASSYEVESFVEGPVDGMAGVAGVHGVGLARRDVHVVSAVPTEEHAAAARGVYAGCKAPAEVIVERDITRLPRADMVVCYHALSFVADDGGDWRAYLAHAASLAKKVLVVTVCNPDNWGVAMIRGIARMRGLRGVEAPESWRTDVLAPELWKLGRVREHTYFDCPWWPDLQVSPGQSLTDRIKKMVAGTGFRFTNAVEGSELAAKFVYGPGRWPYFGGPGWTDNLLPGLLKHPCFEGATPKVRARAAHLHAFVVDMRPRTPQQRRRLATVEA